MRVLVGPTEVAGIAHGLHSGLGQLGIDAELVLEAVHPYSYGPTLAPNRLTRWWGATGSACRNLAARGSWLAWPTAALHLALAWPVLTWAMWRFDAFVFLAGKSITNTALELWLLRLWRKPVVVLFVGSDARPPYVNGAWEWQGARAMARLTRTVLGRVRRFEASHAVCVNAPGTAQFHIKPVVNWFAIGFPSTVQGRAQAPVAAGAGSAPLQPTGQADATRPPAVRLLHSPSNPRLKGTAELEMMVQRLRERGLVIDWLKIAGMNNAAVLQAIGSCDLVVDQLYSDTPMAGLATEAARLGKPAIVGGYLARVAGVIGPAGALPPSCFVDPDHFEAALAGLIQDAQARLALGQAARRFVETVWACPAVAARVLACLKGEIPNEWWWDPSRLDYLSGCGLTEVAGRQRVRQLVDECGVAALGLGHRPKLAAAFVAWARGSAAQSEKQVAETTSA